MIRNGYFIKVSPTGSHEERTAFVTAKKAMRVPQLKQDILSQFAKYRAFEETELRANPKATIPNYGMNYEVVMMAAEFIKEFEENQKSEL